MFNFLIATEVLMSPQHNAARAAYWLIWVFFRVNIRQATDRILTDSRVMNEILDVFFIASARKSITDTN